MTVRLTKHSSSIDSPTLPLIRGMRRNVAPFIVPVLCAALAGCDQGGLNAVSASQKDYKDLLTESQKVTHDQIAQFGAQLTAVQTDQAKKIDDLSRQLKDVTAGVQPLAQKVTALETVQTDLMTAVNKQEALNGKFEKLEKLVEANKTKLGEADTKAFTDALGEIKASMKEISDILTNLGKTLHDTPAPSNPSNSKSNNGPVGMIAAAAAMFAGCPIPVALALGAILGGFGSTSSVQMKAEDAQEILTVANRYQKGEAITPEDWKKVLEILKKYPQFNDLSPYYKGILEQYLGGTLPIPPTTKPPQPTNGDGSEVRK